VISDIEEYKRLVQTATKLGNLAHHFPQYKDQLIQPVISDPEEFKRLVKAVTDLDHLAYNFPQYKDQLIHRRIADTEGFEWLVQTATDLGYRGKNFPQQAIFQEKDLQSALNKLKIDINIKMQGNAYTRGATTGALAGGEYSKTLPLEISSYISSFLGRQHGGKLAQTREAANKLAKEEEEQAISLERHTYKK
jgi:hypothetical protein